MGLFDKKFCDICGNKIGLLGKRKLSDGLLCKDCAGQLSPWFSDRRHAGLAEIREQLAYREANKDAVRRFVVTRSIGDYTKLLIDDTARKFTVASGSDPLSGNPDILDFSQAVSCDLRIDPYRTEKKQTVDGKQVSYQPPKYEYSYTLYATIRVSGNPWFDEMKINIGNGPVSTGELSMDSSLSGSGWNVQGTLGNILNPGITKYHRCLSYGNEMKQAIESMRLQTSVAAQVQTMNSTYAQTQGNPAERWFCPNCGTPNEGNFCINCGTKHPYL